MKLNELIEKLSLIKNMQLKGTDPEVVIDVNTIMGTDYGIVFIFEPPSVLISDR